MSNRALPGVNLGGWLLLEKWIAGNLFNNNSALDEYTYCLNSDEESRAKLKKFRDNFISKDDFVWLSEHGIRAVRIPIGFWVFGGEPPFQSTIAYLDKAFTWAEETNLRILVDFHGLKGSQNGRDHSGKIGTIAWHKKQENVSQSLEVIQKLAHRYANHSALLGISLANEPHPVIPRAELLGFYKNAYEIIRSTCGADPWIVYSDGYLPTRWRNALSGQCFTNVFIDVHHYQIFTPIDKILPPKLSLLRTRLQLPQKVTKLQKYHPVIVGEWSLALHEHRLSHMNQAERESTAINYGVRQLTTFNTIAAWFYWTYKTQSGGTWSYRDCVEKGLIKTPLAT